MPDHYIPALRYHWLTGFYDWLISRFFPEKKFKNALIIQADIKSNSSVLDFGCGTATLTLMAKRHHPDARFTGIDVDENILSIAKKKIIASGAETEVLKYNGGILPFPNKSFDRVITSLVLHHLTPAQRISSLKEINRVLKAGGELHVADWGKAQNIPMRLLFLIVQFLDGFETTRDSVNGLLPEQLATADFKDIRITKNYSTVMGTLSLFKARKSI